MIVSSKIISDDRQADARRWITESHIDESGYDYRVMYLCPADFDAEAAMKARVKQIEADVAAEKANEIVRKGAQVKVDAVLNAAVAKGTITADDIIMAGR